MVLYIEQPFIDFSVFTLILCPLLIKMRADLRPSLVYPINIFFVGSKHVDLEAPRFISSSSEVYEHSNIEQAVVVIILFYQHFVSMTT